MPTRLVSVAGVALALACSLVATPAEAGVGAKLWAWSKWGKGWKHDWSKGEAARAKWNADWSARGGHDWDWRDDWSSDHDWCDGDACDGWKKPNTWGGWKKGHKWGGGKWGGKWKHRGGGTWKHHGGGMKTTTDAKMIREKTPMTMEEEEMPMMMEEESSEYAAPAAEETSDYSEETSYPDESISYDKPTDEGESTPTMEMEEDESSTPMMETDEGESMPMMEMDADEGGDARESSSWKHGGTRMRHHRGGDGDADGGWVPGSGVKAAKCMTRECGWELAKCRKDAKCKAAMQCALACGMGADPESRMCAFQARAVPFFFS
jgi:hypothetical protein